MRKAPFLVFFALAAALSRPVAAAPPEPTAAPKVDPAKVAAERLAEQIKQGNALCVGGDVDQGLPALRAAWTLRQDAELAVALASCEIKAREWPAAADHLAWALRNKDDAETRKSLEATFSNVRARVGAVKVTVTVDGADVFAGDRFAGQSPLPGEVYVAPGPSHIFAKKPGYGEVEGSVDVRPGGTATLKLDLAAQGAVAQSQRVTGSRSAAPAYVMGAIGIAAAGVGAALYAAALSKGAAADDLLSSLVSDFGTNPCYNSTLVTCATLKSYRSSHDTLANAGTGLLAGGGALVGVALVYGLWATFAAPPHERPSYLEARRASPVTVDVGASPGGGGVWLRGAF